MITLTFLYNECRSAKNVCTKKTRPDVQFKEFSLTKQILDLKWTISELRKLFLKKSIKKEITLFMIHRTCSLSQWGLSILR